MNNLNLERKTKDELVSSIENAMSSFILRNTRENHTQKLDVDRKVLESIKTINTRSKYLNIKKQSLIATNLYEADKLSREISRLYRLKEKALRKLVTEHNIKPIGYHLKKNSLQPIPLYVINDFQFHCILDKEKEQDLDIPFLGIFNNDLKRNFNSNRTGEVDDLEYALELLKQY